MTISKDTKADAKSWLMRVAAAKPELPTYASATYASATLEWIAELESQVPQASKLGPVPQASKLGPSLAKPANPRWAGSYTEKVCRRLGYAFGSLPASAPAREIILDAVNLLQDYHETQHVVYEERDKLRAKVAAIKDALS
jgi:hypothetical protein